MSKTIEIPDIAQLEMIIDIKNKRIDELNKRLDKKGKRIDKAIEYINNNGILDLNGYDLLSILRGNNDNWNMETNKRLW